MNIKNTIVIDNNFRWELTNEELYGPLEVPKDRHEYFIYIPPFDPERDLHFSFNNKPALCLQAGEYNPELETIPAIRR
jgi:hypothetical protein